MNVQLPFWSFADKRAHPPGPPLLPKTCPMEGPTQGRLQISQLLPKLQFFFWSYLFLSRITALIHPPPTTTHLITGSDDALSLTTHQPVHG